MINFWIFSFAMIGHLFVVGIVGLFRTSSPPHNTGNRMVNRPTTN